MRIPVAVVQPPENNCVVAPLPPSILRPSSGRRPTSGMQVIRMQLQGDLVHSPAISSAMSYSSTNATHHVPVPQSEFKLQWPKQAYPVSSMSPRFFTPTRGHSRPQAATDLQSNTLSRLSQPANRTPRAWQKVQQLSLDEQQASDSAAGAQTGLGGHRPGWLSARQPLSSNKTPRVQSARTRRPPEWQAGSDTLNGNALSFTSSTGDGPLAGGRIHASLQQLQEDGERQARQEMREYRDKLFEIPKRRFTRREVETFCQKLLGNSDTQQMHSICGKAPDDRSYEDCTFLCKMLSKCSFVQHGLSASTMLAFARCVQGRSLAPGEHLHVDSTTPQIYVLVQGLIAEPTSGDLIKQGDYILRMFEQHSSSSKRLSRRGSSLWGSSMSKISLGTSLRRSTKAKRQPSKSDVLDTSSMPSPAGSGSITPRSGNILRNDDSARESDESASGNVSRQLSSRESPNPSPILVSLYLSRHARIRARAPFCSFVAHASDDECKVPRRIFYMLKEDCITNDAFLQQPASPGLLPMCPEGVSLLGERPPSSDEPFLSSGKPCSSGALLPSHFQAVHQSHLLIFNMTSFVNLADSLEVYATPSSCF